MIRKDYVEKKELPMKWDANAVLNTTQEKQAETDTLYTTTSEHVKDLEKKREISVLWRHCKEKHQSQTQSFKVKVRQVFGGDATLRQITEAVDIRRENSQINNKKEWGHLDLPRIRVE